MPHVATRRVAAAAVLALASLAAAAQPIYKWVDANGRTHYGEKPPDGVKASPVAAPTPPSSSAPATADSPQRWKDAERALREERLEKEKKENAAAAKDARTQAQREARCKQARSALDRLANVQGLYRVDAKGERVYLTDEERAAETRQAREQAKAWCD